MNDILSAQTIQRLLPDWLAEETHYAERKYWFELNPQRTIFQGGLRSGGEAYQEYFRYFGAWKMFTEQADGDPGALLLASQASLKFLNVSRATLCFAINFQQGFGLSASNKEALRKLTDEIPKVTITNVVENPDFVKFQNEILEPSLSEMSNCALLSNESNLITLTMDLFRAQTGLAIGHIATHGQIPTPGMSSGDVSVWDLSK